MTREQLLAEKRFLACLRLLPGCGRRDCSAVRSTRRRAPFCWTNTIPRCRTVRMTSEYNLTFPPFRVSNRREGRNAP